MKPDPKHAGLAVVTVALWGAAWTSCGPSMSHRTHPIGHESATPAAHMPGLSRETICPDSPPPVTGIGVIVVGLDGYFGIEDSELNPATAGINLGAGLPYIRFFFPDPGSGVAACLKSSLDPPASKCFEDVTMADGLSLPKIGIEGKGALVRIELNCGLDLPEDTAAILTFLERIDGTAEYPICLPSSLDHALGVSRERIEARRSEVDAQLASLEASHFTTGQAPIVRETQTPFASWKTDRLEVRVVWSVTATEMQDVQCIMSSTGSDISPLNEVSVELTVTVVFDAAGEAVSIEEGQPVPKSQWFMPPMC